MDLTVRYWSPTHEEVWITYCTSLFFGHAEGEKVAVKMYEQLVSDGIPVAKEVAKEYKFQESSHDAQCQGKDGYKGLTGVLE